MNYKELLKKYTKPSKKGFNLVELVAVIAIIAITSGATLSVFLMVHKVTRDASEITIDQYNTTQMERLIRNEVVVGSDVDFKLGSGFSTGGSYSAVENDEYIQFIGDSVVFKRADDSGKFSTVFTISDVKEVTFAVAPLNDTLADPSGQPFKFFYTISTSHYDYSGGFLLNNTRVKDDDSMKVAGVYTKKITWKKGSTDNDYVFFFHREVSDVTTSSTSSTP